MEGDRAPSLDHLRRLFREGRQNTPENFPDRPNLVGIIAAAKVAAGDDWDEFYSEVSLEWACRENWADVEYVDPIANSNLNRDKGYSYLAARLGNVIDAQDDFADAPVPGMNTPDPIGEADKAARRAKRPTIRFYEDLAKTAAVNDFVEGLLCDNQLSVLYGPSGVGKTFFATDLALCVSLGRKWHGREVERGGVIYVAGEGGAGLGQRVTAFRQQHGLEETDGALFAVINDAVNFRDPQGVGAFISAVNEDAAPRLGGSVRLIVVDTLSRAMAGGNENSPDDMGALITAADRVRAETGAHVMFIHHTGKDAPKGARGHSLLRGAVDTEIEVELTDDRLVVATARKQREMESGAPMTLKRVTVELGTFNRRGKPDTSCVMELAAAPRPVLSPNETKAVGILNNLLFDGQESTVEIAKWRDATLVTLGARGMTRRDTLRQQWKRIRENLVKYGIIEVFGERVSLKTGIGGWRDKA